MDKEGEEAIEKEGKMMIDEEGGWRLREMRGGGSEERCGGWGVGGGMRTEAELQVARERIWLHLFPIRGHFCQGSLPYRKKDSINPI